MILLDLQADKAKTALAQLLLGKEGGKNSDAFAKMLQELSLQGEGEDAKLPFMLLNTAAAETDALPQTLLVSRSEKAHAEDADAKMLLHLLKGEMADAVPAEMAKGASLSTAETEDLALLHPAIDRNGDVTALRKLISEAKSYLKVQIAETAAPKEMPKTLRGLVALAEKIGIDVEKITIEQVRPKGNETEQARMAQQPLIAPKGERQAPAAEQMAKHTTQELVETKQSTVPKAAVKTPEKEQPAPLRTLLQEEPEPAPSKAKGSLNAADDTLPADDAIVKQPAPKTAIPEKGAQEQNGRAQAEVKAQPLKEEPLQAKSAPESASNKTESAPVAASRGQNTPGGSTGQQHGSSQQHAATLPQTTAETLRPDATRNGQPLFDASLSQLLKGESAGDDTEVADAETTNRGSVTETKNSHAAAAVLKHDSLDVKINEAKEMVRHFAADIKEAVQNYKPPFTRIKIQLNPVKLGEVDVTMVQRGNNVHINISSNTTAITTLAQNASELRTQLSQNGMGNTTMNFSSNAEQQQHQHHQQQRQHMAELYEQFENSESFDLLDQLEIIVPRYV